MKDETNRNIEKNILELERLADAVLELKKSIIPRRPIVIEFCGSPKSGKTSCINSLDMFLRRNKFRTRVLTERASICPVKNKHDPYFNIWTITSSLAELSEILSNHPKDFDFVILDRGIFDALCWFKWLYDNNHFDKSNYTSIVSFLTMHRWRSVFDLIYVFSAHPNTSLYREYANLLTRKKGSIMHPVILEGFRKTIDYVIEERKPMFKKVEHIDTTKKELNDVNYEVTKNILNILHDNTSERIGYFSNNIILENMPQTFQYSDIKNKSLILKFEVRKHVEESIDKIQPIPILVITNKNRDKVLVVKKSKKRTSKNSPEGGNLLLYFGGHMREEDVAQSDSEEFINVSRYSLQREIKEETGLDYFPSEDDLPLCIWVKSNERSKKHLALCHVMEAEFETLKVKLDQNEFIVGGKSKSGKVFEVSEIFKQYAELEEWSQIILKNIFGYKPPIEQKSLFKNH